MSRSDDQRLADILEAADQVILLVKRGRQAFDSDIVVRLAIERLLEIIGEAATALSSESREARPDVAWRDVGRLRVVLAHHYHRVDPNLVWSIASGDVPRMVATLRQPGH